MPASPSQNRIIKFGLFEVDLQQGEVRRAGLRLKLGPQPFQVLQAMLERPGELITRDELRERVWTDKTFVDYELGLKKCINRIREVLGDAAESPRFIETVPRRGYRFIAPIEQRGGRSLSDVTSVGHPIAVVPLSETEITNAVAKPPRKVVSSPWILPMVVSAFGILICVSITIAFLRSTKTGAQVESQSIQSLAVLPLENLSGDPSEDYFANGLTDELITALAQMTELRVISRTSVMQFRKARKPVAEIARELNVDGIVEGTVEHSGNRVRITAQLIHAATDTHLWADSYERDLRDVLSLQDDVARDITNKIKIRLTAREGSRSASIGPIDPQAYQSVDAGEKRSHFGRSRSEPQHQRGTIQREPPLSRTR